MQARALPQGPSCAWCLNRGAAACGQMPSTLTLYQAPIRLCLLGASQPSTRAARGQLLSQPVATYHYMCDCVPVHVALFIHVCTGQRIQVLLLKLQHLQLKASRSREGSGAAAVRAAPCCCHWVVWLDKIMASAWSFELCEAAVGSTVRAGRPPVCFSRSTLRFLGLGGCGPTSCSSSSSSSSCPGGGRGGPAAASSASCCCCCCSAVPSASMCAVAAAAAVYQEPCNVCDGAGLDWR